MRKKGDYIKRVNKWKVKNCEVLCHGAAAKKHKSLKLKIK